MKNKETLYLPLKKQWFEMIERGEKLEEYREIKPYWQNRLMADFVIAETENLTATQKRIKPFRKVCFSYGYTKRRIFYKIDSITIGKGRPEWGAPIEKPVFIIKLGERI